MLLPFEMGTLNNALQSFQLHSTINSSVKMSNPEQKAREKLAEAEKKSRGGGGLLGKIFGGGGSDDAANLFIQVNLNNFKSQ